MPPTPHCTHKFQTCVLASICLKRKRFANVRKSVLTSDCTHNQITNNKSLRKHIHTHNTHANREQTGCEGKKERAQARANECMRTAFVRTTCNSWAACPFTPPLSFSSTTSPPQSPQLTTSLRLSPQPCRAPCCNDSPSHHPRPA